MISRLALVPALVFSAGLFLAGLALSLLAIFGIRPFGQSTPSVDVLTHIGDIPGLGASVLATVVVAILSTGVALILGLALALSLREQRRLMSLLAAINIAIPHIVIAVAVGLFLSQSGLLSRLAFSIGWISSPADFPVLTADPWNIGITIAFVVKEAPFIALVALSEMAVAGRDGEMVARTLGASPFQAFRNALWPQIRPAILSATAIILAFTLGSYEVPAILGASHPKLIAVLALELFTGGDIAGRPVAMLLSLLPAILGIAALVAVLRLPQGRRT